MGGDFRNSVIRSSISRKCGWGWLVLLLCVGLIACGQKGALVLPETQAVEQKTESNKDKRPPTTKSETQ